MTDLAAELARCDEEIERCLEELAIDSGALIGLRDWRREKVLIEEEMRRMIKQLQAELEQLRARVAELEAERQWRPISTAPRDARRILAADSATGIIRVAHWRNNRITGMKYWLITGSDQMYAEGYFTHWRPLPAPPEVQELEAERSCQRLFDNCHMSPAGREQQAKSFAFGNTNLSNPSITREHIEDAYEKLKKERPLPKPPEVQG